MHNKLEEELMQQKIKKKDLIFILIN